MHKPQATGTSSGVLALLQAELLQQQCQKHPSKPQRKHQRTHQQTSVTSPSEASQQGQAPKGSFERKWESVNKPSLQLDSYFYQF